MRDLMIAVIQRALAGAETLAPELRADLFDGIAALADGKLPEIAEAAERTAAGIREVEQRQLTFAALLVAEPETKP